ncbi:pyrroline-5-carboxylate reductase [Geomicrobium sp. JCM 19055]|uniref:pyrroline-5-carboxylate reductase n=1 Tax=Geomicrobium sp. JCM 19055 TaxID=1460649 RepID=UPI0005A819AB|nr:pyrroline-5-carboxylate reductase [Geomicrobium sp. JCM 19055]
MKPNLLFVGAGAMAEAIIAGVRATDQTKQTTIKAMNKSNQERLAYMKERYEIETLTDVKEAMNESDVVVLAMKPKDIESAIIQLRPFVTKHHVFYSVLAGTKTDYISSLLGTKNAVIRAMPNTSATVMQSATAICKGEYATDEDVELARSLFLHVGTVTTVTETQMDAVTGISGSGPAYMYYVIEGLMESAERAGIGSDEAKRLIVQTMIGAATRFSHTEQTPKELYKEVMSPGGTTEAAFKHLEMFQVKEHIAKGADAAIGRSKQLGDYDVDHTSIGG